MLALEGNSSEIFSAPKPRRDRSAAHDVDEGSKGRRRLAKERFAEKKANKSQQEATSGVTRLATPDSSDEEDVVEEEEGADSDSSTSAIGEATAFGKHKHAYYSGTNLEAIESDSDVDEETKRELELQEAKKMQALSREGMDDVDFGLPSTLANIDAPRIVFAGLEDFTLEKGTSLSSGSKEEQARRRIEFEQDAANAPAAPQETAAETEEDARNRLFLSLEKSSPETIALAGEFPDVVNDWAIVTTKLSARVSHPLKAEDSDLAGSGLMHLYHQALNAYVTALAYYFYLRAMPEYVRDPSKLRRHPVMERLFKFKKTITSLEDLGLAGVEQIRPYRAPIFVIGMGDDEETEEEEEEDDDDDQEMFEALANGKGQDSESDDEEMEDMDEDELAALRDEATLSEAVVRKAAAAAPADDVEMKLDGGYGKELSKAKSLKGAKSKAKSKAKEAPAPLADLAEYKADDADDFATLLEAGKRPKKRPRSSLDMMTDQAAAEGLGEATHLTAQEEAERAERKRTLKFYTSQISAKEARKGAGLSRRDKLNGDMDLPYRDKNASREAVERARQAKASKDAMLDQGDASLDDSDWNAKDVADRNAVLGFGGADDEFGVDDGGEAGTEAEEYYDLITNSRRAAKKQKKEEYDATQAEIRNLAAEPDLEAGAHRGITRQIEKNKGLAQFRPKSVRNPRVKKRQKYEKAKKKLSSMQAVYKGGLGSLEGGYQGEKSGISSHVVKSRKFA